MNKAEVFKQFIESNDILIVDKNSNSRNRLLKTLLDLGAKRHKVFLTSKIEEANEIIESKDIALVLSDYIIGGGSGFDLFKNCREKDPKNKDLCLVLVTNNISQTAVAKAAEEDVDSFIIKPYTILSLQESLISVVVNKIQPSDYIKKVGEGKLLIKDKKFDEAIETLKVACTLHPKPALALFYIGQAEYYKEFLDDASSSYNKGLSFNNIHYKCLVGLYDLLMERDKFHEAYQVVQKIAKYFPANPDRLSQIIRLAIRTENYQDMQSYYEIFKTLDVRVQALINYIGAGMFISGKHSLLNNDQDEAMRYFDNIAVSCSEFTKFLRAIISLLVEKGMAKAAVKFLERFEPAAREEEDFLISDFLISSSLNQDNGSVIKYGLNIYNKNIRDFACLQALIDAMVKGGYKEDKIAPFRNELRELFPDRLEIPVSA